MASTTFVSNVTRIVRAWLQDVNDSTYGPIAPTTTLRGQLSDPTSASNGAGMVARSEQVVANVAAVRLLSKTSASSYARTLGYYTTNDGGAGSYYYDSSDTTTADDGFACLVAADGGRWKLLVDDFVNIRQAGAKGDNTTDDTTPVQKAVDYCLANKYAMYVPIGKFRLTAQVNVPVYSGVFERGIIIFGAGWGSRFVIDHTGKGFYVTCSPSFGIYQVEFRDLYFTDGTASPSMAIHNSGAINTLVRDCKFHNMTVTTGCVVNDLAYGLRIVGCIFSSIIGTGVVLNQTADIGTTYSFVNTIAECDFGPLTTGVFVYGCNALQVTNTVFEACDIGFSADPTANGTNAFNMTFETCWFERNTTFDLKLASNSSYWCEGSIRNCQFSGFDPTYQCHIDLGEKSRVTIEGAPTGNTVFVSGSAAAAAILIRATNFVQSGTFAWTSIDPVGNIVASTYKSLSGVFASPTSGVAATLTAMANVGSSAWLVTAELDGTGSAANSSCVGVLVTQGTTAVYTAIKTAATLTVSVSGLNLQGTQTTGGVYSITWGLTRLT